MFSPAARIPSSCSRRTALALAATSLFAGGCSFGLGAPRVLGGEEGVADPAGHLDGHRAKKVELERGLTDAFALLQGEADPLLARVGARTAGGGGLPIGEILDEVRATRGEVTVRPVEGHVTFALDPSWPAPGGKVRTPVPPPQLVSHVLPLRLRVERLEAARDAARVGAAELHLAVAVLMSEARAAGRDFDADADAYREHLAIARALDTGAALATCVSASVQACGRGTLGGAELDRVVAEARASLPATEHATVDEVRALYEADAASFDAAFEAMADAVVASSPPSYRAKHRADIEQLFAPLRRRAHGDGAAPPSPGAAPPSPDATDEVDLAAVALAYGSALFPALGVVVAGARAAASLVDGKPEEAVAAAITMIPEGTPARALAEACSTAVQAAVRAASRPQASPGRAAASRAGRGPG